ncbi:hypothetical protein H072_11112 [Dactylellina haptotyla CBS 200.50]|uniref:C2H2-type domain-containing protein n=1 Tax=Dactylellina haptotyla (strain CBS 200.50) TaxID=1284197 RepID=S8B920_DACHA|nr:hypothetical protein H072_11112 [Dactylellina haptotyla CBS 200.50]
MATSQPSLRSWGCNTCGLSFDDGPAQRQHMKEPWHVYNIKRRIASLPPISSEIFHEKVQPQAATVEEDANQESSEEGSSSESDQDTVSPLQCLFCQHDSKDNEDVEGALDHMLVAHGLFVPQQELISDMESFLKYLATQIRVWHECLYCGTTRDSTPAIQSHMRDTDHCMLNLEREPELLDFWENELSEEELTKREQFGLIKREGVKVVSSKEEIQLSSGKVITSKHGPSKKAKAVKERRKARLAVASAEATASTQPEIPDSLINVNPPQHNSKPKGHAGRQLARRDEMSIAGLNPQQRQALMVAEKKSQKQEEVATRAKEWANNRKANKQKHDQAHGPLSWAKGGLHNLLPR